MSFAQFLSILLARWRWFVSIFMGTILLALLLSLVLPKRYTATATVVLDAKPDPVAALTAMYNSASLMPSYLATQADILASDRVARRVVRNLRMADPTRVRLVPCGVDDCARRCGQTVGPQTFGKQGAGRHDPILHRAAAQPGDPRVRIRRRTRRRS